MDYLEFQGVSLLLWQLPMSQSFDVATSFPWLFCFAVSQRHVLARKSLAFHMELFRMMRQRRVSFLAGRSLTQLAEDQSACQRNYSIRGISSFSQRPEDFLSDRVQL